MSTKQFVIFRVENENFGLEIEKVNSIEKPLEIYKVPNTPDFIEGLINLREKVYPVVNMRKRFNLPFDGVNDDTKIIITHLDQMTAGFIVDGVTEIMRIEDTQIEETPIAIKSDKRQFLTGVAKVEHGIILLLDPSKVLSNEEQEIAHSIYTK